MFQVFESRSDLEDWVRNRGRENGCVIVLERSKKNGVDLACNRGGEPKLKATVRRTGSVKKNCHPHILFQFVFSCVSCSLHKDIRSPTHTFSS